ncbi:MAG: flagellar hook-length control protein FliK, partial [Lachnospiraceae bacterium]|nr:flagellar hook-length control protein FliK [Lachnospiraceae bacterium]
MALIQNNAAADKMSFLEFSVPNVSKTSTDTDFEQVMQTTKDAPVEDKAETRDTQTPVKAMEKDTVKEKLSNMSTKTQEKLTSAETEANPEEAAKVLGILMADIRELLMQTFEVSEDELSNMMAELQITDMDLLNPDVINQLAAKLTGAEDMMELLFNPEFADVLKELNQEIAGMKQEAFDTLGVAEKEAVKLLEQLVQTEPEAADETVVKENREASEYEQVTDGQTQETQTQQVTAEHTTAQESSAKDSESGRDFSQNMAQSQTAANPIMANVEQAIEAVLPEVDAESVIRQLVERAHVAVREDVSSFEMQLNPEHLGRINLSVVAKDGMVTAQIAAENAAVKEVLESQIVTLKESLNNQGIQVEAVEVTIASHEFERNLDEQQSRNEDGQNNQKKRFRF